MKMELIIKVIGIALIVSLAFFAIENIFLGLALKAL
jgi:hypothetical protein